jgi:hypothetical protein
MQTKHRASLFCGRPCFHGEEHPSRSIGGPMADDPISVKEFGASFKGFMEQMANQGLLRASSYLSPRRSSAAAYLRARPRTDPAD